LCGWPLFLEEITMTSKRDQSLASLFGMLKPRDAEWFSLRRMTEDMTTQMVRNGKPETNLISHDTGLFIEVFKDGCLGYACTASANPDELQNCLDKALDNARLMSRKPIFRFRREEIRPDVRGTFEGHAGSPFTKDSVGQVADLLVEASQTAKVSPLVVTSVALANYGTRLTEVMSSSGTALTQLVHLVMADVEAIAQDGPITQRRTLGGLRGLSHQGGAERLDRSMLLEGAARVGQQALELLRAEECPSGRFPLVLAPDQMMLQIHESIGHPLELDRILGDERNYAGWSFVKPEDFGRRQYGSTLLNVTFDPTVPQEYASYHYDDIGNKATREFLIKDGLLLRGLGSLESQVRLGLSGVANQRSSAWNRPPIDRMANLNIEPGTSTLDEILGSIEDGIYMEANRSWSIDDFRNKFQFGCEFGRRIRKGKLAGVVRNPNYRGETQTFWHALSHVGDASTLGVYGTPYCGKGEPNQSIRVGHASPACAFQNVEVFGGAG
jgi:predicted Zn-dependent protease